MLGGGETMIRKTGREMENNPGKTHIDTLTHRHTHIHTDRHTQTHTRHSNCLSPLKGGSWGCESVSENSPSRQP